jgi:hypothetical protein
MTLLFSNSLAAGLFLSTIILGSCAKKENESDDITEATEVQSSPNMSWRVNAGEIAFDADTTTYTYDFDESLGLHVMSATDNEGRSLTLMMANLSPGTYEVDFDSTILIWQSGTNIYNGGFNPQGEIVISENANNKIKGTFEASVFSFTTASEIDLTSGTFNLLPIEN